MSRFRGLIVPALDAGLSFGSVVISFVARLDAPLAFSSFTDQIIALGAIAAVLKPAVLHAFGMYSIYWRYVGVREAVKLAAASFSASLALATLAAILQSPIQWLRGVPASIFGIDFLATTLGLATLRVWLHYRLIPSAHPRNGE
jgi:FlaA1/EpsC-like NDP-sugar epimerase